MSELNKAIMLHCSSNNGMTYNALTDIAICNNCGKRTLVCPHKALKETIIELPEGSTHLKSIPVEPDMRFTMSTARNARMSALMENNKFMLLEIVTQLEDIWAEIGIKEDQIEIRSQTVQTHIQDLLKEMLADEEDLKAKIKLNVNEFLIELKQLCQDLGLPEKQMPSNISLLQLEAKLRSDVDTLNKEKHDRLKTLKRLRGEEQAMCDRLVMSQHELNFEGCPTLDQLRELEQNVKFLKAEKMKRLELFQKLQLSIMQLWTDLETTPVTQIEHELCQDNAIEEFILSTDNLDKMTVLQRRLQEEQSHLIQQIDELKKKVESLWERLETPQDEREAFLNKTSDHTPKVAKLFLKEAERLQELKRQHMQKFIESIRKEVVSLWDQCFFGEEQRKVFTAFYSDVFTEETLAEHEHQVATLKNYYNENQEMFKLVEKRQNLWLKKIDFENRSTDFNRLNNRGGALLKEEKIRKAVEKDLPKVESEIKKKVKVWEEENETYFMVNGFRFVDFITQQKEQHEEEVKMKKEEKARQKKAELSEEAQFGSKCSKRKNIGTPSKTKSKFPKMNATHTPSRFIHSSILPSPRVTRSGAENKRMNKTNILKAVKKTNKAKTEARRKSLRRRSNRLANAKRVLEENQDINIMGLHHDDVKVISGSSIAKTSNPNMSLMSYNDFTSAVAESPYSRSSFMCRPEERTPNMVDCSIISKNSTRSFRSSNRTLR